MAGAIPFAKYEVWLLHKSSDTPLAVLNDFTLLQYTKRVSDVGAFELYIPEAALEDYSQLMYDGRVVVWRQPYGGAKAIDFAGLIRHRERYYDKSKMVYLAGFDYNEILRRRIVAYRAASAYSEKDDYADDMMKAIVRENMGALVTDAARRITNGLTIEFDNSQGTVLEMGFAWRNVLEVVQELAEASAETEATRVTFGMVPRAPNGWGFRFATRVPRWGLDHSSDSPLGACIFGLEMGNLEKPSSWTDRRAESNYIYAGGQGEEADRVIEEVYSSQVNVTPLNRCEQFYDGRGFKLANVLRWKARQELAKQRYRQGFEGVLVDTPNLRYGLHYGLGDLVTVEYGTESYDLHIEAVTITVRPDKGEAIVPMFEEPYED